MVDVPEIDSTNVYVMKHAHTLPDFTFFSAQTQTAGKGRVGRTWVSPNCDNLYATFLLKSWPYPAHYATWLASLAIQGTIREVAPEIHSWIKWPNDIMIGDQKLAGILAESQLSSQHAPILALGMGINLNLSLEESQKIEPQPISLKIALENHQNRSKNNDSKKNIKINRTFFKEKLAISLMRVYFKALELGFLSLYADWKAQNELIGREIIFTHPDGKEDVGRVKDVNTDGEIVLQTTQGEFAFSCGDIKISKKSFNILT